MIVRKFKLRLHSYSLSAGILDHRNYDQTIEIASTTQNNQKSEQFEQTFNYDFVISFTFMRSLNEFITSIDP